MWIPEMDPDAVGFSSVDCSRAVVAGLTFRPLSETLRDTLTWLAARPGDWTWRAGLTPEREAELLQVWYGRNLD
jgi:2'-hydroxyisoflavone reductase